jgi:UPF0271 protein
VIIDLNADLGELPDADDAGVMRAVTSANIACGVHAGDAALMDTTVELALMNGVAVGAHPSFPDRAGFGRAMLRLSAVSIEAWIAYQLGALSAIAKARGAHLMHVKPHGAMYNMASVEPDLAEAIARAVKVFDASLVLVGPPASALTVAGARVGLRTAAEAFADRAYRADGTLVPRDEPGAVLTDAEAVAARAVMIAVERRVQTNDGTFMKLEADTICIHGDTPGAASLAAVVRASLEGAGVQVQALRR